MCNQWYWCFLRKIQIHIDSDVSNSLNPSIMLIRPPVVYLNSLGILFYASHVFDFTMNNELLRADSLTWVPVNVPLKSPPTTTNEPITNRSGESFKNRTFLRHPETKRDRDKQRQRHPETNRNTRKKVRHPETKKTRDTPRQGWTQDQT